jgi:putative endonuclease
MKTQPYFIYILLCDNGSYYTGYTTDLTRRYQEHVKGTAKCKFTRSFKPLSIAQSWEILGTKGMAMKMEKFIKTMSKEDKKELILFPEKLAEVFPASLVFADLSCQRKLASRNDADM